MSQREIIGLVVFAQGIILLIVAHYTGHWSMLLVGSVILLWEKLWP